MAGKNKSNIVASFKTILFVIMFLWIILVASWFFPMIKNYGIIPRTESGLPGILFAPFIHADINHLIDNSIGLLILGSIFLIMERKLSFVIVLNIIVLGGLGTWLIGRSVCGGVRCAHIGASGVIYGILGYLVFMGFFTRNVKAIIVSLIVFLLFIVKGQALQGIFPTDRYISWEYHLCGFLAGAITAKIYSKHYRRA
jgi:membrane associated rhomboid family serine protease